MNEAVKTLEQAKTYAIKEYGSIRGFERAHKLKLNSAKKLLSGSTKGLRGDSLKAAILLGIKQDKSKNKIKRKSDSGDFLDHIFVKRLISAIKDSVSENDVVMFSKNSGFPCYVIDSALNKNSDLPMLKRYQVALVFSEWLISNRLSMKPMYPSVISRNQEVISDRIGRALSIAHGFMGAARRKINEAIKNHKGH